MKQFIAIISALFIMGLSFLYPISANAANYVAGDGYHIDDFSTYTQNEYGYYFYFSTTTNKFSKAFFLNVPTSNMDDLVVTQEGQLYEFDLSDCPDARTAWKLYDMSAYAGSNLSSIKYLYVNTVTGGINAYDVNMNEIDLNALGRNVYSSYTTNYTPFKAFDYLTNQVTFQTNWEPANPLNLDFTFNPALSGSVNRTTTVSGIDYTADKFSMSVYNGGENARFAMFIVPSGDDVSFSYGGWDSTMEISSNPVFAFVTDEWTSTGATLDNLSMTNQTYSPSFLHYIASGGYQSYEIAWSSMNLSANTSYDVVCYGCLGTGGAYDGQSGMALNDTFEEVYRSTFTIVNPAVFNPTNDITGNYSWDNTQSNNDLFKNVKAGYDNFGNFYVNQAANSRLNINSSLNTQKAFGSYFNFLNSVLSFFPPEFLTLILIGISALVVVGIIKAVSH